MVHSSALSHLRCLHTIVRPPESPFVQRYSQIGARYFGFIRPLQLLIGNALFIKLHSAITASLSFYGWLVKLVVAAVAVALILR